MAASLGAAGEHVIFGSDEKEDDVRLLSLKLALNENWAQTMYRGAASVCPRGAISLNEILRVVVNYHHQASEQLGDSASSPNIPLRLVS